MFMSLCVCAFCIICLAILARICFLIFLKHNNEVKRPTRTEPVKTMIILGSGGHTAEILRIIGHLDLSNYSPRVYVHAQTDKLSADKVQELEVGQTDYKITEVYRSREVRQSYLTSIYTTIYATIMEDATILTLAPWYLLLENVQKHVPSEIKVHMEPIVSLLNKNYQSIGNLSSDWIKKSLILTEASLDKTWEVLNSGYWKDVPIEYRYTYSICTTVKAVLLDIQSECRTEDFIGNKESMKRSIIKQIDKGILLGAPLPNMPSLLTTIASNINIYLSSLKKTAGSKEIVIDTESIYDEIPPRFSPLHSLDEPSMESFYRDVFMPKKPAILRGCIQHWKAITQWKNLDYLNQIAGSRTVPIEIGSRYTEDDWTQHLVNFSDFLQEHITKKNDRVGYLAQHQLFDQIPELKDDFTVPEYCSFSDSDDPERPDINAWFGPAGTVSPLHFDPKNNLLCQVFGYKRVILYHPDDTPNLYPYDTRLLNNTAQVDPINPDYEKWPDLHKAKGIMCYLKAGEMLYIPPKWWHHVISLTPSFSVSFWWD